MKTSVDCIPCLIRRMIGYSRMLTEFPAVHERILRDILRLAVEADFSQSPQVLAQQIYCLLTQVAGNTDIFHSERKRFTQSAMSLLPELKLRTESASDPLMTAVRFAIAGNVIHMPGNTRITSRNIRESIRRVLTEAFSENREEFHESLKNANNILYLTDSAGEIVFDRLLVEQLLPAKVTVAVHGKPVFENATINDAEACGLHEIAKIIDKGSVSPGTFIDDCSEEFLDHYRNADLVIAKGLDNFESLSDQQQNIFFLFPVKCPVIASHTGYPVGAHLLIKQNSVTANVSHSSYYADQNIHRAFSPAAFSENLF